MRSLWFSPVVLVLFVLTACESKRVEESPPTPVASTVEDPNKPVTEPAPEVRPEPTVPKEPHPARNFAAVVREHFRRWDRSRDGLIDGAEILQLVRDPRVKGEEAAAVAAIHQLHGFTRQPLEPSTLETILAYDKLPGLYAGNLQLIAHTRREVFAEGAPRLDEFHQGHQGDCYYLSVLGAAVARDPIAVRRLLPAAEGGGCLLRFPGKQPILVTPITDAELTLGSHAVAQGLWGPYFEKGFGRYVESQGAVRPDEEAIDVIGHAGRMSVAIALLTGHRVDGINMTKERKEAALPERAAKAIAAAHHERRLISCDTQHNVELPPGVNGGHAYAVLGYNPERRLVEVWNPHGNTFAPKGPPGRAHGYVTRSGKFEIPLDDFVQVFNLLVWEVPVSGAKSAQLELIVPDKAEVWIDGVRLPGAGTRHRYVSGPLSAGQDHTYEVVARFHQDGRLVTRRERVTLRAGEEKGVEVR